MRIKSGRCSRASSTASTASLASGTTSNPASSRINRRSARTIGSSSTVRTRAVACNDTMWLPPVVATKRPQALRLRSPVTVGRRLRRPGGMVPTGALRTEWLLLRPPHLARQLAQEHPLQHLDRLGETFIDGDEPVLVLDAQNAVVAGDAQCAHEVAPELLVLAVPDAAERPRPLRKTPVVLRVEHAVHADVRAVEIDVLGVHVEDRTRLTEFAHRNERIDALPDKVTRIEVRADLRTGGFAEAQHRLGVVDEEAGMRFERDLRQSGLPRERSFGLPVRDRHFVPLPFERLAVFRRPCARDPVRRASIGAVAGAAREAGDDIDAE